MKHEAFKPTSLNMGNGSESQNPMSFLSVEPHYPCEYCPLFTYKGCSVTEEHIDSADRKDPQAAGIISLSMSLCRR